MTATIRYYPNAKIQGAIHKLVEEESIVDAKKTTVDTFIYAPNTYRQNANAIFTREKLDKSEKLAYAVKNLTINDAKYYELNTANASEAQGNFAGNP